MLPKLRYLTKQAVSVSVRSLGITFLAVITIGASLTVLAAFGVVVQSLSEVAVRLGQEVEVSAYLVRNTPPGDGFALARQLESWPEVAGARFSSSEAALEAFRESLGEEGSLLEGLPPDVLPASVEIQVRPEAWTRETVEALATRLEALAPVEEVRFGREAIEQVNGVLEVARVAAWIVGLVLGLGAILVVSNTIRLTVYARRDEIEVMSLVGATSTFVRAPFVMEGMLQGFLGGALAFGVLLSMQGGLRLVLERGLGVGMEVTLAWSPIEYALALVAGGVGLGLIASLAAVGRFLKV